MQQWLGHLLDRDRARSSDLVRPLAEYLRAGGSNASPAEKRNLRRSTVKHRLQRIRDVSGSTSRTRRLSSGCERQDLRVQQALVAGDPDGEEDGQRGTGHGGGRADDRLGGDER